MSPSLMYLRKKRRGLLPEGVLGVQPVEPIVWANYGLNGLFCHKSFHARSRDSRVIGLRL